ncbi:MAG: PAS domain S-box protein [Bacteroidota bacterium]|nr:PAS domain S-box protein [Bacteroidota bacterium]
MKSRRVISIAFVILLLVSFVFAIVTYNNNKALKKSNLWLNHTTIVLFKSEQLLSILKDVETSTRGFVITGNDLYLRPYYIAKNKIKKTVSDLKNLTRDNAIQQERMDTLISLANTKLAISSQIQYSRKANNYSSESVQPLMLRGMNVMDSIRSTVTGFQDEENRLLNVREKAYNIYSAKTRTGFFLLLASSLVLLIITSFTISYFTISPKSSANVLAKPEARVGFFSKRVDDILKGISDPFFALDKDLNFMFLNDAAKQIIARDKIISGTTNMFEALPRYNGTLVASNINKVIQTKQSIFFEFYDNFLDLWQDVAIYPTTEGISITMKNASIRKLHEEELNKTKLLLEETNDVAKVGGWELDIAKGTLNWTSITYAIHETSPEFKPNLKSSIGFFKKGYSSNTIIQLINACLEEGKEWDEELQIVTAKGNERWVRTKGKAQFQNNVCVRLYGMFQDIDAQKNMQSLLTQNEMKFRSAFDNSLDGMAITNNESVILQANDALSNMLGYSKKDLEGITVTEITADADKPHNNKIFKDLYNGKITTLRYEKRFLHKDGQIVRTETCASCIKDANDNVLNCVLQIKDITKAKFSEEQLLNEKKLFKTVLDSLPVNVYMKDLQSRKTLVNKSELDYSGASSEEEILGKSDMDLYPRENALISIREDNEIFSTGTPMLNKETKSVKADGTETWFITSKIPFKNDNNEVAGLIGISLDITARKLLEKYL